MNWFTVAWSMAASACLMLALMHLVFWLKERRAVVYLLSSGAALSAAAVAMTELSMLTTSSVETYRRLLIWQHVPLALLLGCTVWFVQAYSAFARRWMAILVTLLWSLALIVNFVSPDSLVFAEIVELKRQRSFLGQEYSLASGPANPWKPLADAASALIVLYFVDASVREWRAGKRRRAVALGVGFGGFIVAAGIHTPLVDAGVVRTPYMVGFAFLAIVSVMSYQLVSDAVQSFRLTREIRANEKRWRFLMETVHLVAIGVDPHGDIDYVNPYYEELTGFSRESILGRSVALIAAPSERDALLEAFRRASEASRLPPTQWKLRCASGRERTLSWSTARLADAEGAFSGLLSLGLDMTEQLTARDELQRLHREIAHLSRIHAVGELASALAHELNQPLTAILSNAQAARRHLEANRPDLEEIRAIVEDIIADDKRAGEVIHRLRGMLRRSENAPERVDIGEAIRGAMTLLHTELIRAGVSLTLDLAPDLPPVMTGRVEVQQVVLNLVMNAIESMREMPSAEREVRVRTCRDDGFVIVAVRDTGPGLPPELLGRVFDPFVTTKDSGLGVGLAVCRRLVEQHGGCIRAYNNEDGAGATVEFSQRIAASG